MMKKKKNGFSRSLQNLLAISGMDAAELAQTLDVGLPEISRWLDGSAAPDVYQLQELAGQFGMPYAYFFENDRGLPDAPEVAAWLGLSEETVKALREVADTVPQESLEALDTAIYALAAAVSRAGEAAR